VTSSRNLPPPTWCSLVAACWCSAATGIARDGAEMMKKNLRVQGSMRQGRSPCAGQRAQRHIGSSRNIFVGMHGTPCIPRVKAAHSNYEQLGCRFSAGACLRVQVRRSTIRSSNRFVVARLAMFARTLQHRKEVPMDGTNELKETTRVTASSTQRWRRLFGHGYKWISDRATT
jgi:hypothetical protein